LGEFVHVQKFQYLDHERTYIACALQSFTEKFSPNIKLHDLGNEGIEALIRESARGMHFFASSWRAQQFKFRSFEYFLNVIKEGECSSNLNFTSSSSFGSCNFPFSTEIGVLHKFDIFHDILLHPYNLIPHEICHILVLVLKKIGMFAYIAQS
jgi:hypothetical protein